MDKLITAVLVGAGNRADVYASVAKRHPDRIKIVGIVEPDEKRRELMRKKYDVSAETCFSSVEEFTAREKFADAVINGTMDHLHVITSVPILKRGYDLLLEKPFAVNEAEMKLLNDTAKMCGRRVVICHVLRYTEFYRAIKRAAAGIGDIISIEMCEHVNYHHMAVSYVRGKWRSEKVCFAPMLLAKSCHDIDIMLWMMKGSGALPSSVASFGSDFQFGRERKPEGAGSRCMADCPFVDECIFSAKANYLSAVRWGQYVWRCLDGEELTDERKAESLRRDNPYGRCVWDFDRDGNVDHQNVIINFSNGAVGSFSMIGGSAKSERNIHIVGTRGEVKGTFEDSKYVVRRMAPDTKAGYTEEAHDLRVEGDMIGASGGHGGGDENLVLDFVNYLNGHEVSDSCATLEDSIVSHLTVFRADEARRTGSVVKIY